MNHRVEGWVTNSDGWLPIQIEDFLSIKFKGFQDANDVLHEFTLENLPFMNPCNWLSLFYIVAKDGNMSILLNT